MGAGAFRTAVSVLALAAMLAGCRSPQPSISEAAIQTEAAAQLIDSVTDRAQQQFAEDDIAFETDKPYLGDLVPRRIDEKSAAKNTKLQMPIRITYVEPVTLAELGRLVASQTGISVTVDSDIAEHKLPDIQFSGTVEQGLDYVTDRMGYAWSATASRVRLFATTLRIWKLLAPAAESQWQATVGLSGSVQSASSGSDLRAQDQVVFSADSSDFWDQADATITGLLTPAGRHTLNRETGDLIVTDTPTALDRVDRWITQKNRDLATQVLLSIDLYEIEQSSDAHSGFNLSGALQQAFGDDLYSLNFESDDQGDLVGFQFKNNQEPDSDVTDITAILRYAVGDGSVSKLTSTVIRGLNGQPAPVFFGDERSYLERREVVTKEGIPSVRLVPGKLQDGIALSILPNVLQDSGRMMLNITMRTTRIKSISRFPADAGPDDPVIQLPDLESRSVLLTVLMQNGETLFVAGLDTTRNAHSGADGILSRRRKADDRKASLVMLITPRIIPPPAEITASQ